MNPWLVIYRSAWLALVILSAVGLVCIFLPRGQDYRALQQKKVRLEQEVAALEASVKKLQVQQERLQTDSVFVERTARELGMAMPGETIYRVMPSPSHTAAQPFAAKRGD